MTPEAMIRALIATGERCSVELANTVKRRPAGSRTSATRTVVAARIPIRNRHGGWRRGGTGEPLMWGRPPARAPRGGGPGGRAGGGARGAGPGRHRPRGGGGGGTEAP